MKICNIISHPISTSGSSIMDYFLDLSIQNFSKISLITSKNYQYNKDDDGKIEYFYYNEINGKNKLSKIINIQLQPIIQLRKQKKHGGLNLFILAENLLLPVVYLKGIGKKVHIIVTIDNLSNNRNGILSSILTFFTYLLSDAIILPHDNSVYIPKFLEKKVVCGTHHFIRTDDILFKDDILERENIVGYVGRFSHEKGIENFLRGIKVLLRSDNKIRFVIVGDGPKQGFVKEFIKANNLSEFIAVYPWLSSDEVKQIFRRIKLLVIPSDTEIGPYIGLEAMASGIPVLSTRVGLMKGLVIHDETGFILENNHPETIAQGIVSSITSDNLSQIAVKANKKVLEMYSFETVNNQFNNLIEEIEE